MNIWKRLNLLESEVESQQDSLEETDKCARRLITKIEKLEKTVNGRAMFRGTVGFHYVGFEGLGLVSRQGYLEKTVKQQNQIIEQLATLLNKKIINAVDPEYEKILVDISEDEH